MKEELQKKIEAVLFYKGEPVKIRELASLLDSDQTQVREALGELQTTLAARGIRLVIEGEYAGLATAPELRTLIERMRKEELEGPLGKAGLETLAIVLYHGPISKADIEYIRGVNCSSILRSLSMRGLIEKTENPEDKRSSLYRTTPALPATLGMTKTSDAPDFDSIKTQIASILDARPQEVHGEEKTPSA